VSGGGAVAAVVRETLPNARFLCRAEDGREVTCHVSGEMRWKVVRLLPGDEVVIEPSPRDPSLGRIVGRAGRRGT
jgi:translation initiation factor IF-1